MHGHVCHTAIASAVEGGPCLSLTQSLCFSERLQCIGKAKTVIAAPMHYMPSTQSPCLSQQGHRILD